MIQRIEFPLSSKILKSPFRLFAFMYLRIYVAFLKSAIGVSFLLTIVVLSIAYFLTGSVHFFNAFIDSAVFMFMLPFVIALEEFFHTVTAIAIGKIATIRSFLIGNYKLGKISISIGYAAIDYYGKFNKKEQLYISSAGPITTIVFMLLINLVVFLINPVIKIQFMLGIVTLSPLMAFIPGSRILKSDGYTILHCARSLNYNILTTLTEVLLSARFPLYYLKSTDKAFIESCTSISEAYQEIEKLMENENYTEAILVYEKLIEIRPDDATIMNNLAWLYHKTGEYQKAFNYSKAAISLSDDPDFKENYEEIKGILEISVPGTSDSVIN